MWQFERPNFSSLSILFVYSFILGGLSLLNLLQFPTFVSALKHLQGTFLLIAISSIDPLCPLLSLDARRILFLPFHLHTRPPRTLIRVKIIDTNLQAHTSPRKHDEWKHLSKPACRLIRALSLYIETYPLQRIEEKTRYIYTHSLVLRFYSAFVRERGRNRRGEEKLILTSRARRIIPALRAPRNAISSGATAATPRVCTLLYASGLDVAFIIARAKLPEWE